MFQRLTRAGVCFLLVTLLYGLYAVAVVPLIEPTVERPRGGGNGGDITGPILVINDVPLEELFEEDAWERSTHAKVFETELGAVLFRDYQPRPNGTLELKPVTLIYAPAESRESTPIIVEAPQGAVIQSDRPINIARADFGKPLGARLLGQIIIRRPRSAPDRDDELFILTRNVKIDRQKIWTPNDVEFRFGPHWGRGRDLQIMLEEKSNISPASAAEKRGPGRAVRTLELIQLEKILLVPGDGLLSRVTGATKASPSTQQKSAMPPVPIEIRCEGPFRFDFVRAVATLSEQVRLTRPQSTGVTDTLQCDLLELFFRPAKGAQKGKLAAAVADAPAATLSSLAIDRLVATGSPVLFEAPSENAAARADTVEFFYRQRRIVLEGSPIAWLRHGTQEIESPRLDYTLHPESADRAGVLHAAGPGQVRGVADGDSPLPGQPRTADDRPRNFTATWREALQLQPLDDRHVLTFQGGGTVQVQDMGSFSADELHLLLREEATAAGDGSGISDASGTKENQFRLVPDRLIALRDVRLESPQLHGTGIQELKVWFVPADTSVAAPVSHTQVEPVDAPGGQQSGVSLPALSHTLTPYRPKKPAAVQRPLHFTGDRVEARVLAGEQMQLTDLTVAGNIRVSRDPVDASPKGSLFLQGDLLQVTEIGQGQAHIDVRGNPAAAGAEGLLLRGQQILCQQEANIMWIPGAGEMLTPPRPAGQNGTSPAAPAMRVQWGGHMQFDGHVVSFHDNVEAHGQQVSDNGDQHEFVVRSNELFVELDRRVDFAKPQTEGQPEVNLHMLRIPGRVNMENHTSAAGQRKSWEQMEVSDLVIDRITGRLDAQGPGWLSSVRVAGAANNPATALPGAAGKLVHIQVRFQRAVVGNLLQRQVEFFDRVQTTYCPINDWNERIDVQQSQLPHGAVEMNSDRLQLAEMRLPDAPTSTYREFQALGNVVARGEMFRATGHQLSYDDAKDLLILRSDGRGYATVATATSNGSIEAKEIHIRPKTKEVKTVGQRSLDFSPPSR